ncbi:MAG: acyl-CoA dehydrogenase family protein, partial [Alphaproteobacteria bacterium]
IMTQTAILDKVVPIGQKIDLIRVLADIGPTCCKTAAESDARGAFVDSNYELLREHKVFSALVPLDLGGGGACHRDMCEFLRGLAHHCPSTALALSMHQHLVAAAVANHLKGRPGRKLLDRVAADQTILVSTGANDWMESNGTVERVDGGYRVSARKPFGSGAPRGGILVTSAPFKDPKDGWQVLHFPVPFSAKGVSLAGDWDTLGMRATGSETVILDNVFVPDEAIALRRPRGKYHMAWNVILTVAMPLIVSVYVGVAEKAAEIAVEHALKRGDDPSSAYLVGEMTNLLTTAQLARDDMLRITNDFDFEPTVENVSATLIRKTIAANALLAATEKAMEVTGGAGFMRKTGIERLLRDAHGVSFHPLPEKRQHLFTGRLALGRDPISGTTVV